VAFHREAGVPKAGVSGAAGGYGGSVYVETSAQYQDLSSVPRLVKAKGGGGGQGSWMAGLRGSDRVIKVPFGTIIREIKDETPLAEIDEDDVEQRNRLFVLYPGSTEATGPSAKAMKRIGSSLLHQERKAKQVARMRPPLVLDLSAENQPPILLARGGAGGMGNSMLASNELKVPRFATKGRPGERVRFHLELKTIADVGLVGMPNRGKSSLLRALTNSKSRVASFAFTTLYPHVAPVVLREDGSLLTDSASAVEDGWPTLDAAVAPRDDGDLQESFRFTIADTPGLLRDAATNGLGSTFLRHIERARVLVYVVDLSLPHPELELDMLAAELETHQEGLSGRAKLVVANKADLLDGLDDGLSERIATLQAWCDERGAGLVVCSAKQRGNIQKLAWTLRDLLLAP
jgi:GTP-binding protein